MATGIVSAALSLTGWHRCSVALLVVAVAALIVLSALAVTRTVLFGQDVIADARDPRQGFGFFTIVAALNVVGVGLYTPGRPWPTIVLAVISVPVWLLLTYGIPSALMLRARQEPVAGQVDGSWFLWVVGTQSLATVAAVIGTTAGNAALAETAVALWGIGVMLYLLLVALVTLRLLTVSSSPATLTPSYWIYMGATAISVLAGSSILLLPVTMPIMVTTAPVVAGVTYLLWAFGTWCVPFLLLFGLWRHLLRHVRFRYETGLWSIVFPLGMYSVASMHFGAIERLPVLVTIGQCSTAAAAATWILTTLSAIHSATRYLRTRRSRSQAIPPS